jgi:hypothetical protein
MKKVDLSDLKEGDLAWDYQLGLVAITEIRKGNDYCIETDSGGYTIDGKLWVNDNHPTLFHSEQEFLEYWGIESNQLTKREQFSKAAMQGLLANGMYTSNGAIELADALLTKLNEKP